jgi:tetratricopeptide (TPR) repeat protein
LEKAIEIKRRAQRCIQSGDLDGALSEYGKLTGSEDSDPYTFVLIADLQFKKGEPGDASQSYLAGVGAYEKAGLYKNAIAICKKMMRLSLSAPIVLQRLAQLHALDGLGTEASLYYMQYAEHLTREEQYRDAGATLRKAYEACSENLQTLERLAEVQLLAGDESDAVATLLEAAQRYQEAGDINAASRVIARAEHVRPGSAGSLASDAPPAPRAAASPELIEAPAAAEAPVPDGASAEVVPDIVPTPDELEQPVAIEKIQTASAAVDPADISSAGDWFTTAASDMGVSPSGPGLRFDATAEAAREGVPHRPAEDDGKLAAIEALLGEAEEHFRTGERESATAALVRAARAYDELQRYDSSAAIYRSLSRSAHVTTEVMSLWLKNCEAREDRTEASQVACALGERSLNDGDLVGARVWFEEALRYDPNNDLAKRRIQRMEPDAAAAAPEQPVAPESNGRVEVALGRAQAVTMELGSMIEEFQRGIEAQLSGDAQSHYDLGVTYREMGLLEQAADAFRVAAADPAYAGRCAEMIGRTLLDQGRFDEAVDEFVGALARPLDPDAQLNLRFHLGLALEAAGRAQEALTEFEAVYAAQANYPEVAAKIRGLRRTLENV